MNDSGFGMDRKVLLTGFRGTSTEKLLEDITDFDVLVLPNDKIKDSEKLITAISAKNYDYVISIGQRPNIRNKVHIETTARADDKLVVTDFDCARMADVFRQNGISAKLSNNAGTSFCNQLFLNGLLFLYQKNVNTKMVFIHIPYMKNIEDFKVFQSLFLKVIREGVR